MSQKWLFTLKYTCQWWDVSVGSRGGDELHNV